MLQGIVGRGGMGLMTIGLLAMVSCPDRGIVSEMAQRSRSGLNPSLCYVQYSSGVIRDLSPWCGSGERRQRQQQACELTRSCGGVPPIRQGIPNQPAG